MPDPNRGDSYPVPVGTGIWIGQETETANIKQLSLIRAWGLEAGICIPIFNLRGGLREPQAASGHTGGGI